jgi:hypothetical protein
VCRVKEGHGYSVQTALAASGGKMNEKDEFVATTATKGRIGLKRSKKELIFLVAEDQASDLREIARLPFTNGTIRAVRLFADPGGSPTAIDARLKPITIKGNEITGGVPASERRMSRWWWALAIVPVVAGGLVFWRWRARRGADE